MSTSKAEANQRNQEKLGRAVAILRNVSEQPGVPRNARGLVRQSLILLGDEKVALALRIVNVVSLLDAAPQDPGLPSYARVAIWSAISELESIRD
jgi:uncharacterized protein (UPF0147 family)